MTKVINDLFDYDLKIVQDEKNFKFSLDSILLAEFVNLKKDNLKVVDFCTGNAPIPMILTTKRINRCLGIELQTKIWKLAVEGIKINKLDNIQILNADVKNVSKFLEAETVDIVTCNPPYFKVSKSLVNDNEIKAIARHEIKLTLEEVVKSASFILKNKGNFYLCHRPERLDEILIILNKYNLTPKKLQFIYSGLNNNAIMVLIEACKNGKNALKVLKPIDILNVKSYKGIVGGK